MEISIINIHFLYSIYQVEIEEKKVKSGNVMQMHWSLKVLIWKCIQFLKHFQILEFVIIYFNVLSRLMSVEV